MTFRDVNRLRILFLSHYFPTKWTGAGVRTSSLLRSLSRLGDVTLVCRQPADVTPEDLHNIKRLCSQFITVPNGSFDWISGIHRLLGSNNKCVKLIPLLLSRKPIFLNYGLMVKNNSIALSSYLGAVRWSDYDILHVGKLMMADVIYESLTRIKECGVYTVVDLDDIDSIVIRRSLMLPSSRPRTAVGRCLHRLDLLRLERYERKIVPLFDASIVCSDVDRDKVVARRLSRNPWIIPNGVDVEYFRPGEREDGCPRDLLFLGNMNYSANVDAVKYFLEKIFPHIVEKMPDCRFVIVGRNAVKALANVTQGHGIRIVGDVADTRVFYRKAALVVTPIRIGGGTRVKILEAMAMGKAIVSTTLGAEGIDAADGKEIALADEEEEFAAKCVFLLGDRRVRGAMGENARRLVAEKYDVKVIDKSIQGYYLSARGIGGECCGRSECGSATP